MSQVRLSPSTADAQSKRSSVGRRQLRRPCERPRRLAEGRTPRTPRAKGALSVTPLGSRPRRGVLVAFEADVDASGQVSRSEGCERP